MHVSFSQAGQKAREEWAVRRSPDDTCILITVNEGF